MKKNVNYIDAVKFETIILEAGLTMAPQAGFVKVSGPTGRNLYVAKTKRVGRIDLSGFTVEIPGVRTLDEDEKFGNVLQQVDFSRSEEEVLATFKTLLETMKSLAPVEKPSRKKSEPKAPVATGWTSLPAEPSKEERLAKLKAAKEARDAKKAAKAAASSQVA